MPRASSTSDRRQGTSLQFVFNLEFELTIDYLSSKVPGSVGWNFLVGLEKDLDQFEGSKLFKLQKLRIRIRIFIYLPHAIQRCNFQQHIISIRRFISSTQVYTKYTMVGV